MFLTICGLAMSLCMVVIKGCVLPIHFTFSFNQIPLLTYQSDQYGENKHKPKNWLKLHNPSLIYSSKLVFKIVVVVVIVIVEFNNQIR